MLLGMFTEINWKKLILNMIFFMQIKIKTTNRVYVEIANDQAFDDDDNIGWFGNFLQKIKATEKNNLKIVAFKIASYIKQLQKDSRRGKPF